MPPTPTLVTNLAAQFADRPAAGQRISLVPSGLLPIDEHLHGIVPGRTYVLSGAPGTGKSVASMQFLMAALKQGERAAILTQDDPEDLLAQSEYLGFDLAQAVASDQLAFLRFQLDFSRRFGRAPSPEPAIAELRKLLGAPPSRIVIDSVVPFIDGGTSSATSTIALLQLVEELGATAFITYPGDLAGAYDRRLDPLVQRAAAILHLTADRMRHRQIEIRKVRYRVPSVSPIPYRIEAGAGIVMAAEEVRWQNEESAAVPGDRQRFVLDIPNGAASEALRLLQSHYSVKVVSNTRPTPAAPLSLVPARRSADVSDEDGMEPDLPVQLTRDGERVAFDRAGFNAAISDIIADDPRALFALVAITPPPGLLGPLGGVSLRTVRAVNGDLVAVTESQVLIYLHGTGRKHARYFVERLRENWKNAGAGELVVDVLGYPADHDRIRMLLNPAR